MTPLSPKPGGLKILHLIGSTDPEAGGPTEALRQLDVHWSQTDEASSEVVSADYPGAAYLTQHSFKVHALGEISPLMRILGVARYRYSSRLNRWLRENAERYDAVIVHGLWNGATLAGRLTFGSLSVPYFVFPHGMLDPWFRRRYPVKHVLKQLSWLGCEGPLLSRARAVLFTCQEERKAAHGAFFGFPYEAVVSGLGIAAPPTVTPLETKRFRAHVPSIGDEPYLLFLGRIHPKKGCDMIIDALLRLNARFTPKIVMVGPEADGWGQMLRTKAKTAGLDEAIVWSGPIYGDLKWGALAGAEAFILPSHQENFGIAVAEALSVGTPVLISNKVNIWREIEQGGSGLVEDDSIDGTTALLKRWVLMSDEDRSTMRLCAKKTFVRHFDVARTASEIMRIITPAPS